MSHPETQTQRRRHLGAWFDSPLGYALQAFEANHLRNVLPHLYGTVAAQLGRIGRLELLDSCIAPTRILLDPDRSADGARVQGLPEALPLDAKSVDVALLPHTLDFCDDPHQVLREVARVLSPEGHVVILGFNPVSMWGARRILTHKPRPAPWCGNFFRLARIKDWLSLLNFELTHGQMLFYRPPFGSEGVLQRMRFLDKMGDRWWPLMAAVYLVVAKKRVVGMTPMPLEWKTRRVVGRMATQSATSRGIVIPFQQRRIKPLG